MKKLFFLAVFFCSGAASFAQRPVTTKPAATVVAPIDNRAKMDKMKSEMMGLLAQYNKQMNAAQAIMNKVDSIRKDLHASMKSLEAQDKLGNFQIQDLMSRYNQAETLSSNVLKKVSDSKSAIIKNMD